MRQVHLAVLIHGLHGNPGNMAECKAELVKAFEARKSQPGGGGGGLPPHQDLEVFVPSTFTGGLTFDGIEILALRVAEELDAKMERLSSQGLTVDGFSIVSCCLPYSIDG